MKKFFFKLHRILGSILSLVFFMWFISGIIMIYSGFPRLNRQEAFEYLEPLKTYCSTIETPIQDSIIPQQITLEVLHNKPVYTYGNRTLNAQTLVHIESFSTRTLDSLVTSQYQSTIRKKKILTTYDTWIPWSSYAAYFPIHKYYLNDTKKTVVYVAQTTGKVVQVTTAKTRWFARFGAIPHWFYYKGLRLKQNLWADIIIWISGVGCILAISGLIVGIYVSRKWRKSKKKGFLNLSPYRNKWYRWHHLLGLVFGVFVFTFVFSGMLSLMDIPQWILPIYKKPNYTQLWSEKASGFSLFKLPIQRVLEEPQFANVRQIQYRQIDSVPYYLLYEKYRQPLFVRADRDDSPTIHTFAYDEIASIAAKKFNGYPFSIEHMTADDNYYKIRKSTVAKLRFDDHNKTWIYIDADNPTTLRISNKSRRISRWLYKGLHTFNFPGLSKMEWLRKSLLIVTCLFGAVISLSGVILGFRYIKRRGKKWKKQSFKSKDKK